MPSNSHRPEHPALFTCNFLVPSCLLIFQTFFLCLPFFLFLRGIVYTLSYCMNVTFRLLLIELLFESSWGPITSAFYTITLISSTSLLICLLRALNCRCCILMRESIKHPPQLQTENKEVIIFSRLRGVKICS